MVVETDRPHRSNSLSNSNTIATTTATAAAAASSELFICFTSRLSSSITTASATSMKLPHSKSILSPGRPRDPHSSSQISLSTSLSRRLRSNGSLKGGQASPMFPPGTAAAAAGGGGGGNGGKRKGCAFENPEPSSPKVTCIGQVRVKSKKQGRKKISKRSGSGREMSFRNDRPFAGGGEESAASGQCWNGKWVHDLPLTICESLRSFGSEFNCFLPCRSGSSCMAGDKDGVNKEERSPGGGFCGAVFARWVEEEEEGGRKGRSIELVVGEEGREGEGIRRDTEMGGDGAELDRGRSYRRHVFEEIEFTDDKIAGGGEEEINGGRVSICIPPKNALLLMRCRSDPVKMAALANKFFEEPPAPPEEEEEEEVDEEEEEEKGRGAGQEEVAEVGGDERKVAAEEEQGREKEKRGGGVDVECEEKLVTFEANVEEDAREDTGEQEGTGKQVICLVNLEVEEEDENPDGKEPIRKSITLEGLEQVEEELLMEEEEGEEEAQAPEEANLPAGTEALLDPETVADPDGEEMQRVSALDQGQVPAGDDEEEEQREETKQKEKPREEGEEEETTGKPVLPDCLLLMMCEPKLSMEVSKETWVCSTDFVRWLPGGRSKQPVKRTDGEDEAAGKKKQADGDVIRREVNAGEPAPVAAAIGKNKENSNNDNNGGSKNEALQLQPPRSSCYYPAQPPRVKGESMASVIEKKLVGAKGYEPFVLTRCKSEPMRTAAAKLIPQDACFWKNRKLEQAAANTVGVGAAGVGF